MNEDEVVDRTIRAYTADGWVLIYRTRRIAKGAIGGVDAILMKQDPPRFTLIEAKGFAEKKERRSSDFTNCLGAVLKRIRFEHGYSSNEAVNCFLPNGELTAEDVRAQLSEHGKYKNSEYVLALTPDMRKTVIAALDSTLAALLHISVALVSENDVVKMQW